MTTPNVADLIRILMAFHDQFKPATISVSYELPDGHVLTACLTGGELLSLEHDDGHLAVVPLKEAAEW